MNLSVVTTLYYSAPYVKEFYDRITLSAERITKDFEIIFVNDGSPDNALEIAVELHKSDSRVRVVDLSRNFGHHKAMMTGLAHARGQHVFLIDSDLEEEPEWLPYFVEQLGRERCDVVYGIQSKRKGGLFERWSGQLFYIFFRAVTKLTLPKDIVTARLMTRRYVNALIQHNEREIFMAGLWHITGFDQSPKIVKKHRSSETTYTLWRKISLLINSITSFSNTPLIGIFYIGIVISLIAGAYTLFLLFNWLFIYKPLSGWTSIIASIWLLGGLIISFIGIVGIYISKIFSETKRRPYTIIRQVYEKKQSID